MNKYFIVSILISSFFLTSCSEQAQEAVKTPTYEWKDINTTQPVSKEETLRMWAIELAVENLSKMWQFYSETIWFQILMSTGNTLYLWDNWIIFLKLIEESTYVHAPKWEAWLYHLAITHTSQKSLAERIRNIIIKNPELFQWSSDHIATEAFYFTDPEWNWLELYYDKPRSEWRYQDGKPVMWSTYIDTPTYIKRYADVPISGGIASMWHVHLKIGSIEEAERFYHDILLFDVMNNAGSALFVSRDGYHHHLGLNTWESLGSKKRTSKTYGLKSYEIMYTPRLYEQIRTNLNTAKIPYEEKDALIIVDDPWGNTIKVRQL